MGIGCPQAVKLSRGPFPVSAGSPLFSKPEHPDHGPSSLHRTVQRLYHEPQADDLSGNWLKAEGRRKVSEGYVNFATLLNDYILVYAIQKYLLREGEGFYITDLGK